MWVGKGTSVRGKGAEKGRGEVGWLVGVVVVVQGSSAARPKHMLSCRCVLWREKEQQHTYGDIRAACINDTGCADDVDVLVVVDLALADGVCKSALGARRDGVGETVERALGDKVANRNS